MASISEASYGARLRNAQDLVTILANMSYVPARPTESIAELTALSNTVAAINTTIAVSQQNYNQANQNRTLLFKKDTHSVIKILSSIRKYIDAFYGKNTLQAKQVATIINRMRSNRVTVVAATGTTEVRTISNSEQSFGALTQMFSDLVSTLGNYPDYAPLVPHLQVASLENMLVQINALNNDVVNYNTILRNARAQRVMLYDDLKDRCIRIKSLITANYGMQSQEYKNLKGLKF